VPLWASSIAGFVLGTIVGSFLATILMRWPQGRSAVAGRSHCDGCGAVLGPAELVPLLSWLVFRGRCRRCGARIDWRHTAVELAGGIVGLTAAIVEPLPLALVTMAFGWWLLLTAALDAEHEWLPDALTLPLVPLGLLARWAGLGPPLLDRVIGAAVGWLVLAGMALAYRQLRGREGLGGGDPKLLAGIGAWLGWQCLPFVLLGAGLLGLLALLLMRLRGAPVGASTRLPLGALMALAAWPIWLILPAFHSAAVYPDLL
jgi:leader peptidase (prepilin peptidase) / N-methyltransferase